MITTSRLRPRALRTVVALATVAGCAAFLPATAQAATVHALPASTVRPADGTGTTNTNTPLFATPSSSEGSEITLRSGYSLELYCWVDGGWYDGTNRWFETNYYGMWYYVSADMISNQPSLPSC
jgi:hypothetical protein